MAWKSGKKYYLNKFSGSKNEALEEIHYAVREDNTGPKTIYASTFLKDGEWLLVVQQESEDAFSDLRRTEIAATKEIKKRFPLVEVILLAGHGTTASIVDGMKQGAYDYLLKPADISELETKLEGVRKNKEAQEERIRKAEARLLLRRSGNI